MPSEPQAFFLHRDFNTCGKAAQMPHGSLMEAVALTALRYHSEADRDKADERVDGCRFDNGSHLFLE